MSVPNDLDLMDDELLAVEALVLPIDENESELDFQVMEDVVVPSSVRQVATPPPHSPTTTATDPGQDPTIPPTDASETHPTVSETPHSSGISSAVVSFASAATATTPVKNGCKAMVGYAKGKETQTPIKQSSDVIYDYGTAEEIGKILKEELGEDIPEVNIAWVTDIYENMASDSEVNDYLDTCGFYDSEVRRWVGLPEVANTELMLYDPFCDIINSILEHFNLSGPMGSVRKAIDTHDIRLKHGGPEPTNRVSSPDISIKASGPSFIRPIEGTEVGYDNMAAFFDGKRDGDVNEKAKHIVQFGTYTRQMFIHQPNRRYVRCMALTERRARVYHFDRSGAQYTELFDIHLNPRLFVRLVIGLCTTDERLLGLDDTVKWTVGPNGLRTGGTLRTVGPNNVPVTYRLSTREKPWYRSSLRGRGIVCWPVKNKKGEMLIVKDYWMSEGRTPEYELLEHLKGIPGVCQLVSYEGGREQTKDFRGNTHNFSKDVFHNSIAIRLTLRAYGTSIDNFTSPEEMLAALRDAIAAHRGVVSKGLFHRDICHNNVLIGIHGIQAKVGERGMLMDFDMSAGPLTGKPPSDISEGFRSGILVFQSANIAQGMAVLPKGGKSNKSMTAPPPNLKFPMHDHFDELESFFWIFSYLIFTHNPTGGKGPAIPTQKFFKKMMMTPDFAAGAKDALLTSDMALGEAKLYLYDGWRDVGCLHLFTEWREIMAARFSKKAKLFYEEPTPREDGAAPGNRFAETLDSEDVDKVYERILGLIDIALMKALEKAAPPLRRSRRLLTRARSLDHIGVDSNVEEAPEASGSGSNKRSAREVDDAEDSPTKPKRACPPSRAAGPSTLSQFVSYETDSDDGV